TQAKEYRNRLDPAVLKERKRQDYIRNWQSHQRRRARRRGADGMFSSAEWTLLVWLFQGRCAYCWQEKKLTIDHVIPLSRGGSNFIENIVPACQSCNSTKYNKLITSL